MLVVFAVERVLRELMQPAKINLASLGNMTAHLHWHVIPRFADDKHFPGSIWSEARRPGAFHHVHGAAGDNALALLLDRRSVNRTSPARWRARCCWPTWPPR